MRHTNPLRSLALAITCAVVFTSPAVALANAPLPFSDANALAHIKVLCGSGVRVEGSKAEHRAFDYITRQLRTSGYKVTTQNVKLPKGKSTHNVIVTKPGASSKTIVLGAHVDGKSPSPSANDNGSGVATLLELARDLRNADTEPTVRIVFFGAEEMSDSNPDHHHYGSRAYVRSLTRTQRNQIAGMVSVDMVGYGSTFNVRSMRVGPQTVVTSLQRASRASGQPMPFLKDLGRTGWSDHEAFERAGIPAAWMEWRNDPTCHTSKDRVSHISRKRLASSGSILLKWLTAMTGTELNQLRP